MIETPYGAPLAHRSITERMIGAAMLDVGTYEEVERDRTATGQAAAVVAMVAVASAIGSSGGGFGSAIAMLVWSLFSWAIWAGVTYLIGTTFFEGRADWGELLRTLGFAQAPGVLKVLGIAPGLGTIVSILVGVWMLVTGIVAIRQALDVTTGKAILVAIVGWLVLMIPMMIMGMIVIAISGIFH